MQRCCMASPSLGGRELQAVSSTSADALDCQPLGLIPGWTMVHNATRRARLEEQQVSMGGDKVNDLLVTLGKAQVDAMFCRQEDLPVDDSEFLPLVEAILIGFEMAGIEGAVVEAVWEHAFRVYDHACKEAEPESTTAENTELMRSYLLGKWHENRNR